MNKRITGMLAGTTLAVAALGSAAYAENAEDIMQKNREAMSGVTAADFTVDMKADMTIKDNSQGLSVSMNGSGAADISVTTEPLALHFAGNFEGNALGENMTAAVEAYLVPSAEDDIYMIYAGFNGDWTSEEQDVTELKGLLNAEGSEVLDTSALPVSWELAEDTVDVNGTQCYELVSTLTWEDVKKIIAWTQTTAEESGVDTQDIESYLAMMDMFDGYLDELQLNMVADIASDSYETRQFTVNMDGSDWAKVMDLMVDMGAMSSDSEDGFDGSIAFDELYLTLTYTGEAEEITVPDEVVTLAVASAETPDSEADPAEPVMTYGDYTIELEPYSLDYLYIADNYISGYFPEGDYYFMGRIEEYYNTEEAVKEQRDWDNDWYTEEYEGAEVSEVQTAALDADDADAASELYYYAVTYSDEEYAYTSCRYYIYVMKGDVCYHVEISETADTAEEITLDNDKAVELLGMVQLH